MLDLTVTWLSYLALLLACVAGLFLNLLGLPGIWLIVVAAMLYGWLIGYIGLWTIVALVLLGVLAELVEFLAGAAGSKSAGGSKRGMAGAVLGGLVGGILGTFIPIPVLGTILGSVAGCFGGAYAVEWYIGKTHGDAARISYGAAKGRIFGLVAKSIFGCAMAATAAIVGLPIRFVNDALPTPPATQPIEATTTMPVA